MPAAARALTPDPLNANAIRRALAAHGLRVEVLQTCDSTNARLLAGAATPALLAAELQTAGRGRRGRRWHAPHGTGLTFSVACEFPGSPARLAALPLAVGVAAARALRALGAHAVGLKWPNDLVANGAKLGGILVQTRAVGGGTRAVAGLGINCRSAPGVAARTRRRVIALDSLLAPLPPRNLLIARLGVEVLAAMHAFAHNGLDAVREDWELLHAHAGRRMVLRLADGRRASGIAEGLAADGGLRLRGRTGLREFAGAAVRSARAA